ncbi:MAG: beta-galactosidase [Clostridia bacterium]|nr:beta-galactosidase [Clostridia bacterium]
MFVFGTQYLRGATPKRDQWEKDLYNIRNYGFNTVRAWLVWNTLEKAEGEIDYDYLDTFLSVAKKNDLDVGLLFHLHACPAWAVKKYSKYFYVNEDSLPFEPAVRPNTPGGGWPGLCFDNDEVREMEKGFIEKVVSHTKNYSNVAFYEPMNEPHQWIDLKKSPCGVFCYCDASVAKFRTWLENKYTHIENLNNAWGMFYTSFDEVRPPRWFSSYSDYTDWRLFTVDNVTEEIKFRTDVIKANDTKPVIAHAWGGGTTTCPQLGGMAFDDWKNAKVFDKWGYSAFPNTSADCASLGLGCDSTRCAAGGKEYWQSELTAGLVGTGLNIKGRIDDNTFDKFSLESIRHGATGLLYWQYRKELFGTEFGGFSMVDYDGGPTNLSLRASKLCKMLQENEKSFKEGTQKAAEVGLVFSMRSYLAAWSANDKMDNKFAVDSLSGYYKMFWEENITTDIIHEEFAEDLERYRVIILPSPYAVSPSFVAKLREYVKNGGVVISDPFFGAFDETMALSSHVPGLDTLEMFGAEEDDITIREKVFLYDGKEKLEFAGNRHLETFRNVTGKALYNYEDGTPAIVENNYGKGKAFLSGINLGLCYSAKTLISDDVISKDTANASISAKNVVLDICKRADVCGNICSAENVKVSYIKNDNPDTPDIIILINSGASEATGAVMVEKVYSECCDVYENTKCGISGNKVEFTIGADKSAVIKLNK